MAAGNLFRWKTGFIVNDGLGIMSYGEHALNMLINCPCPRSVTLFANIQTLPKANRLEAESKVEPNEKG